jgi:hypothetical protein
MVSYTLMFWTAPVDGLGGEPTVESMVALLRRIGRPVDSVSHSSSGGEWFREEFIAGAVARAIGAVPAGYLIDRPLGGFEWSDGYPSMGWLSRSELVDAVERLRGSSPAGDDEEVDELMESFVDILEMAVLSGQDLVTVYD